MMPQTIDSPFSLDKNDLPLVSLIIPFHNNELTLPRLLLSLEQLTYPAVDIIFVDDRTEDASTAIVKESPLPKRILSTENFGATGVSAARNLGLSAARGKYVTFLDADDWVEPDYLNPMVLAAQNQSANIVVNTSYFRDNHIVDINCLETGPVPSQNVLSLIYQEKIYMAVWNRLFNTSFLLQNRIAFDETVWYAEGMLFMATCLTKTKLATVISVPLYHYISNPKSVMRKGFSIANETNALLSFSKQRDLLSQLPKHGWRHTLRSLARHAAYVVIRCIKMISLNRVDIPPLFVLALPFWASNAKFARENRVKERFLFLFSSIFPNLTIKYLVRKSGVTHE